MNSQKNNFTNVCRTCLVENRNMKSLFSIEEIMEQKIMLCHMLMSCASILIIEGDGLPENVCLNCLQQANKAYLFRKLCERSDASLRECSTFVNLTGNQDKVYTTTLAELNIDEKSLGDDNFLKNSISIEELINEPRVEDLDSKQSNESNSDEITEKVLNPNKNYSCKKCNELCISLTSLRTHMADIHGELYKCEHCGKQFKTRNFLASHKNSSHNDLTRSGRQRNKTGIVKKRDLPRTCEICDKTFRFHSNLERHKLTHTGEKPYLCNVCGKGFAQMAYLKIHSFIHTGEKPYKCQMCERSFAAPGTLMTHIRTHTGERPHICKICGKDFPQAGYLSSHIRTHTGEKPVECKVCNRRFNQTSRLTVHMRIHTGEKPHQCKECGKGFAVRSTLKKHIRTHTGERPYKCKVCGQGFAQSGTLATHMKVHRALTVIS